MACTPKKLVHWALDTSNSDFGSPFSDTASSDTSSSTSTLQYVNSQLLAHGFTRPPGLLLDGLSNDDSERVVKCVLGLLSQRVEDMARTEDLATKLRTLSYDHDRLMSMHRVALERAATAEKEASLSKSRLTAAHRSLQTAESAHRQTTADLQRTRSALFSVRQTHAAELKRREKEAERMVERWTKLSDAQVKLGAASAGLTFKASHANAAVGPAVEGVLGKGKNLLEQALDDAEHARNELGEENRKLKDMTINAVNGLAAVLHTARKSDEEDNPEPVPYTLATLFPLSPAGVAAEKASTLISSLRETMVRLMETPTVIVSVTPSTSTPDTKAHTTVNADVEHLQAVIKGLRADLEKSHKQANAHAAQSRALLDGITSDRFSGEREDTGEISVELMRAPERDEVHQTLDKWKNDLDEERSKFTEAAVKLGRKKASLEAERVKFLEEKRSWQVQTMLAELPPTPQAGSSSAVDPSVDSAGKYSPTRSMHKSKCRSPHRSPLKASKRSAGKPSAGLVIPVGKAGLVSGRRTRLCLTPKSPSKVVPSFETEVIPQHLLAQAFSMESIPGVASSSQPLILPTAFVLPPPSPLASISSQPDLLSSLRPQAASDLPRSRSLPVLQTVNSQPAVQPTASHFPMSPSVPNLPSSPSSLLDLSPSSSDNVLVPHPGTPCTPAALRRPFPMAKPLAPYMIHAYSPAKPSPLSRILMMNSPVSPEINVPETVLESDEEGASQLQRSAPSGASGLPPVRPVDAVPVPVMSLEAELGLEDVSDDSPLKEKRDKLNVRDAAAKAARGTKKGEGDRQRPAPAKEKGKGKASASLRAAKPAAREKENAAVARQRASAPGAGPAAPRARSRASPPAAPGEQTAANSARAAGAAKPPHGTTKAAALAVAAKGGARRVPTDAGHMWRG